MLLASTLFGTIPFETQKRTIPVWFYRAYKRVAYSPQKKKLSNVGKDAFWSWNSLLWLNVITSKTDAAVNWYFMHVAQSGSITGEVKKQNSSVQAIELLN